jgi:hypothetical protein
MFYAKVSLFFMFITGIMQIDMLNLSWEIFRVIQPIHAFLSLIISLVIIAPFLYKHIKMSILLNKQKSLSGVVFGVTFVLMFLSGVYLLFVGNRGGDILGLSAFYIHLFGSFALIFALVMHIKESISLNTVLALFMLFVPMQSFAKSKKLQNIILEEGGSRYHPKDWTNSATCKECHPMIFKQWANSNHRHMADSNPYYMVLENLAGMDMGEEFKQWCMGCHNPSAVTLKRTKTTHFMDENIMPDPLFVKDSKNLIQTYKKHPKTLEQGVSCVGCHRIVDAKPSGNSSFTLSLKNRKKYIFEDEHSDVKVAIKNYMINANPRTHKKSYLKPLYKESKLCASCHNEFLPHSSKMVVSTYDEWRDSPYNDPKNPKNHKECIDCHMGYFKDGKQTPMSGYSTKGGEYKKDIKTHYFSGGNFFLAGLKSKEHKQQAIELLKTSAKLDCKLSGSTLLVGVTNVNAGHHLPTGASDFRELWLDITVKDKDNNIIFSSGKLDKNGNIEKNSVIFQKVFGDKNSKPVGLFFWRYEKLLKDNRIPAKKRVQNSFDLPKNISYPIKVDIKLNYRIYPQWVTDIVKNAYPQLIDPEVLTISQLKKEFK